MNLLFYGNPRGPLAPYERAARDQGHRVSWRNIRFFNSGNDAEPCDGVVVEAHDPRMGLLAAGYLGRSSVMAIGKVVPQGFYAIASLTAPGYTPFKALQEYMPQGAVLTGTLASILPVGQGNAQGTPLEAPGSPVVERTRVSRYLPRPVFETAPRVVVLGGGPSLRDFNWDLLKGECVVGANRACEKPHVSLAVTMDQRFTRWTLGGQLGDEARRAWQEFPGLRVFAEADAQKHLDVLDTGLATMRREHASSGAGTYTLPTIDNMAQCTNSGLAALLVAVAHGAKDIMLLGFDLGGEGGKQAWHHEPYPSIEGDDTYAKMLQEFQAYKPLLDEAGVRITVYGESALVSRAGWKGASLRAAEQRLRRQAERPLLVTYWTDDEYEAEAREMLRTARVCGFEVKGYRLGHVKGWLQATAKKAEFLERMLQHHERPILWVDADCRIRQYPRLLDGPFEYDMALSWLDWDQFPADSRNGLELSTGVMLLCPTYNTYALLREWQDINLARPQVWEQKNLQTLMEEKPNRVRTLELPMSYNQVFDHMASLGAPVIEHFPHSRVLRREGRMS